MLSRASKADDALMFFDGDTVAPGTATSDSVHIAPGLGMELRIEATDFLDSSTTLDGVLEASVDGTTYTDLITITQMTEAGSASYALGNTENIYYRFNPDVSTADTVKLSAFITGR